MKHIQDNFGYLLNMASRQMKWQFNNRLKDLELTSSQWAVLKDLSINKSSSDATPASIAERLYIDRPTLSGIIERLMKRGWVYSVANPNDRRSQIISLTEKAKNTVPQLEKLSSLTIEHSLQGFSAEEIDSLKGYLKKIIINLSQD